MARFAERPRPGGYAARRYRDGLRRWRRRTRPVLVAALGPFVALGLIGGAVAQRPLAWASGAVFGFAVGVWIALRESPPAHVENWNTGAEGERKTARALRRLDPAIWLAAHDVDAARGNYDHILIGPPGVLLLETKYPQGDVFLRGGELRLRRRDDPEADRPCPWLRGEALARAAALSEELARRTGHRVWVQAVVVLWSGFQDGVHEDGRCAFVHGPRLRRWLEGRPPARPGGELDDAREAVTQMTLS